MKTALKPANSNRRLDTEVKKPVWYSLTRKTEKVVEILAALADKDVETQRIDFLPEPSLAGCFELRTENDFRLKAPTIKGIVVVWKADKMKEVREGFFSPPAWPSFEIEEHVMDPGPYNMLYHDHTVWARQPKKKENVQD